MRLVIKGILVMYSEAQMQAMQQTHTTEINYIMPGVNAAFDLSTDAKSANKLTEQVDTRQVNITNARLLAHPPTLLKDGFGLTNNNYHVSNYFDDNEVQQALYSQVINHLVSLTGAVKGMVFDHTLRSVENDLQRSEKRSPINTVHNDYIASSAESRLEVELAKQQLNASDYRKYQFINTWIPLVDVVKDSPLALADARTFLPEQSLKLAVTYPDRMGEIEGFSYHKANRWYFYPNMTRHEQLNFIVFDSDVNSVITRVPHSAFLLPIAEENITPRISIEIRSILLFN